MEQYIQDITLINQFIKGLLSKSEANHFENKLKTDITFKSTYNTHLVFLEGLKRKALKTEIQAAHQSYLRSKWLKYLCICGAAIIVLAVLFSLFSKPEASNLEPTTNPMEIVSDSMLTKNPSERTVETKEIITNTTSKAMITEDKVDLKTETFQEEKKEDSEADTQKPDAVEAIQEIVELNKPEPLRKELIAFYKSVKKDPEIIEINNEKETIITCKEGIILIIPEKAFIHVKSGKLARGKITLEIIEFHTLSDILLANLTTKSDDRLLETGGMLHISAYKDDGSLKIKSGKYIEIKFPNKGKENMQLFSGETQAYTINWELQNDSVLRSTGTKDSIQFIEEDAMITDLLEEDVQVPITIVEEVPVLPGCENQSQDEKRKCLQDYLNVFMEKNFNTSIAEDLNLKGNHKIKVAFKINTEGKIDNIEAFASHIKLAQEAIRVLELVPQMLPASQRNRPVIIPYSMPVYFSVGRSTKNNPSLIKVKSRTTFKNSINTRLATRDSIKLGTNSNGFEAKIIRKPSVNDLTNYAFSTSQLGWINCDRFVKTKNKFKLKIKIKDAEGANVKMIFKSLSSILPSKSYQNEFDFGTVPANEQVTLVAIKEVDDQFYLAIQDIETALNPKLDLEFKAVTINELKAELKKLNKTFN